MEHRLLLVEDDSFLAKAARLVLSESGFKVAVASTLAEAKSALDTFKPDIVVLDLILPDGIGSNLVSRMRKRGDFTPVIAISGQATEDVAVASLEDHGASLYLQKPFGSDLLIAQARALLRERQAWATQVTHRDGTAPQVLPDSQPDSIQEADFASDNPSVEPEREIPAELQFAQKHGIVSLSPKIARAITLARAAATESITVLLQGETGVGKELFARLIHAESKRNGHLVPVNCAALSDGLLESELFGHEKGAFTGADYRRLGLVGSAAGGTLFLDEIGDLNHALQAKMLRLLENKEVRPLGSDHAYETDTRFVAATNKDLALEVEAGRFRRDLFARLEQYVIPIVPLRERREDIPIITQHILKERSISVQALRLLMRYDWPGNVRELKGALQFAVTVSKTGMIQPADLPESITKATERRMSVPKEPGVSVPQVPLAVVEREHITAVVEQSPNLVTAADILGIDRATLYRKLKTFGHDWRKKLRDTENLEEHDSS